MFVDTDKTFYLSEKQVDIDHDFLESEVGCLVKPKTLEVLLDYLLQFLIDSRAYSFLDCSSIRACYYCYNYLLFYS